MRAIYPLLFRAYVEQADWIYEYRVQNSEFIQNAFAFTLYLLHLHGDEWRNAVFYEDAFLRAFPLLIEEIGPGRYESAEDLARRTYTMQSMVRFADFMGLVELETTWWNDFREAVRLKKKPLLEDVARFRVSRRQDPEAVS